MGVYQSITAPEVRRMGYTCRVSAEMLDIFGLDDIAAILRDRHRIPLGAEPSLVGNVIIFSWFEVETFN